ncbi:MAG: phospholipid carrier-dependent glycosyltransferase [Clostridiales bacterium]|nr:phospholipid carrier-dependent glycosyltransferase [Clostridiales bacterium]
MENNSNSLLLDGETENLTLRRKVFKGVSEVVFFCAIFLLTLALFIVVRPLYENNGLGIRKGMVAQIIMAVLIGITVCFGAIYAIYNKLDRKTAVFLIFVIGVILRIGYMLYTPATARQQDTFNRANTGHEAYAWSIFSTGKLPTTNDYQFYHPPLNAFVQSCFMHFMDWFSSALSQIFNLNGYFPNAFLQGYSSSRLPEGSEYRFFLYSANQVISAFYSIVTLVYSLKLVKLFGFKDNIGVLVSAIVILFPRNVQFAGMLNNDAPSYMFSILALYTALKWQKQGKKLWNILLCGLFCGLGMMAKLGSATICLPIAGIFIYEFIVFIKEFIKDVKEKKVNLLNSLKLPLSYVGFLIICAPLALWFQVYASQKFGQQFGFVFGNLNGLLKTDHHSLFERLVVTFDLSEYFGSVYCVPFSTEIDGQIVAYNNYNLFHYQLRSGIFGEFTYWQGEGIAVLCVIFAYAFCILLAIGFIKSFITYLNYNKGKNELFKGGELINLKDFLFVFLLMQSQVLPEIFFYVKMPYACTMDFRYVMPIISALALTSGYVIKILNAEGSAFSLKLSNFIMLSAVMTLSCTSMFYCICI